MRFFLFAHVSLELKCGYAGLSAELAWYSSVRVQHSVFPGQPFVIQPL